MDPHPFVTRPAERTPDRPDAAGAPGAPPSSASPASPAASVRARVAEALLSAALQARRAGALDAFVARRARLAHWLSRRHLRPVSTAADTALADRPAEALDLLLRWAVWRLRPDRAEADAPPDEATWLERTSWRPWLALRCYVGLATVPDFPRRYRRRPGESVLDNLCGIWSVGPSTVYRYLDKARHRMVDDLLQLEASPALRHALRRWAAAAVSAEIARTGRPGEDPAAWHAAQSQRFLARNEPLAALWHAAPGGRAAACVEVLRRFRLALAAEPEADAIVADLLAGELPPRDRVRLLVAWADILRAREDEDTAREVHELAVQVAHRHDDPLMLGVAYGALGKFHEPRDADRCRSYLESGVECLRRAHEAARRDAAAAAEAREAAIEYQTALQRLAWSYILSSDPRAEQVLAVADTLRDPALLSGESIALLEQAWGEYWRRAGRLRPAIEHQHRALAIFERLGDQRQVLSTCNNLCIAYSEAREPARALAYARRILDIDRASPVDPYLRASALLNGGIAHFLQDELDEAIDLYERSAAVAGDAGLALIAQRARYNLAEACFKRFALRGDPADEARGDALVDALVDGPAAGADPTVLQAAPGLKDEVLGAHEGFIHTRLASEEHAVHPQEMRVVAQQRRALALPDAPGDRLAAQVAIARAYAVMALRERDRALALAGELPPALAGEHRAALDELQSMFARHATRERALQAAWRQATAPWLSEDRIARVVDWLLAQGTIGKSGYARLCEVGLATASKHLATLTALGLLQQSGRGPSTCYRLPAEGTGGDAA